MLKYCFLKQNTKKNKENHNLFKKKTQKIEVIKKGKIYSNIKNLITQFDMYSIIF